MHCFLIIATSYIFSNYARAEKFDFPDIFYSKGTFVLPYGDITQRFELWYDATNNRARMEINNGTFIRIFAKGEVNDIYYYSTEHSKPVRTCDTDDFHSITKYSRDIIPDMSKFEYKGIDADTQLKKWVFLEKVLNYTNRYVLYVDNANKPVSFESYGVDYFSRKHPDEYKLNYLTFNPLSRIDDSVFDTSKFKCSSSSTSHSSNEMTFAPLTSFLKEQTIKSNGIVRVVANEFEQKYAYLLGYRRPKNYESFKFPLYRKESNSNDISVKTFDWRLYGVGGKVKDQGVCGSCWTFSVVGAIEGALQAAIYRKSRPNDFQFLAEQYLIDCSWEMNNGCGGGWPGATLKWVVENQIPYFSSYGSYEAINGKCHNATERFSLKGVYQVDTTKSDAIENIKSALTKFGPLSVLVTVTTPFVYYTGGVFGSPDCGGDLNHAVVLVGWGFDEMTQQEYWIVRNSWSNNFGVNGFIHLSMKYDCGMSEEVFAAVV